MKKYWYNTGKYQKEYDEMLEANHEFTKKSNAIAYRYYRYYNDGDKPHGMSYESVSFIETYLEEQADKMVCYEYKRFKKEAK